MVFKIGSKITHILSENTYYYIGPVPDRALETIVSEDGQKAYTVETQQLDRYYELAPITVKFEENRKYKNNATGSILTVQRAFTNPSSGNIAYFGWVETGLNNTYAMIVYESDAPKYTKVTENV